MTFDLLELVDLLTLPKPEKVAQRHDYGWKIAWVSHDPLLKQFGDAVWPSSNSSAGSASMASTRSLVDLDALFKYAKLSSAIGDWCHAVGVRATRKPVNDLRAWYAAYLKFDQADASFYEKQLRGWVGMIRHHLQPNDGFDLQYPCPVCGKRAWSDGNPDGAGGTFPLRVEYQKGDNATTRHRAECRAPDCATAWEGIDAVAELASELTGEPVENIMRALTDGKVAA